ncbi:MAG: hypothetical protein ACOX6V_05345 [Patescibacteria group bacterium]|jgi:adenine C2-methylase RlmN of 23S rRNA A2503 and tRNA A37
MDFSNLKIVLERNNEPKYRYNQITSDVVSGRVQSYREIFTIPKKLRELLERKLPFISNKLETINISSDKRAYKALLKLHD